MFINLFVSISIMPGQGDSVPAQVTAQRTPVWLGGWKMWVHFTVEVGDNMVPKEG